MGTNPWTNAPGTGRDLPVPNESPFEDKLDYSKIQGGYADDSLDSLWNYKPCKVNKFVADDITFNHYLNYSPHNLFAYAGIKWRTIGISPYPQNGRLYLMQKDSFYPTYHLVTFIATSWGMRMWLTDNGFYFHVENGDKFMEIEPV